LALVELARSAAALEQLEQILFLALSPLLAVVTEPMAMQETAAQVEAQS
jgi:hypothetical protein